MYKALFQLESLGPNVAVVLAAVGLMFGLFGWRIIRYLVVVDALLIALLVGGLLEGMKDSAEMVVLVQASTFLLAIGLPWLAWRYHRGAIAAMGGAVWFFLPQVMLVGSGTPLLVRLLLGGVGCVLAMALHLTLYREAAVLTSGLHGGWLCLAAFLIASADPLSFGRQLAYALSGHALLLPLVALLISTIMIAMQWADLDRTMEPCENS